MNKPSFSLIISILFILTMMIQNATALPSPSIDMGSNPIFTLSGQGYAGGTFSQVIATAPVDKDMRITDIHLTSCCDSYAYGSQITLTTSSGSIIGRWSVNRNTPFVASMESGLVIPAGESITLSATRNNNSVYVYYTFSGIYTRP
jgi:hypothetical protein